MMKRRQDVLASAFFISCLDEGQNRGPNQKSIKILRDVLQKNASTSPS
jgi:hypothetical protein